MKSGAFDGLVVGKADLVGRMTRQWVVYSDLH